MADIYFSGQGKVWTSDRDANGNSTVFQDLGNVPSLRVAFDTTTIEHKESQTGQRIVDFRLITEKKATITMELEDWTSANLNYLMFGTSGSITGAAVTNELTTTGITANQYVATRYPFISAVTITDSAGTPATVALTTNYVITDATAGLIKFVNVGSFVQPFKINYTYATMESVAMFRAAAVERYLKFSGLNTANANKAVVIDLYRVIFDPTKQFDLITDELGKFTLEGSVLYDSTRSTDSTLGGFGRVLGSTTI